MEASWEDKQRQNGLIIASVVLTVMAAVFVILRAISRFVLIRNPGPDDYFILAALTFTIAYVIVLFILKENHIGFPMEMLTPDNMVNFLKATLSIQVMYYSNIFCIKTSILFTYLRFAVTRTFRVLCIGTIILHTVFFVVCVAVTLAQCTPLHEMWDLSKIVARTQNCIDTTAFFYFTSGFNIITDLWILIMPLKTLHGINRPNREKIALFVIFGVGTFAVVASIVRLHTIYVYTLADDPFRDGVLVNLWSVIEVTIAISCASVSALKPIFSGRQRQVSRAAVSGNSNYDLRYMRSQSSHNRRVSMRWHLRLGSKEFGSLPGAAEYKGSNATTSSGSRSGSASDPRSSTDMIEKGGLPVQRPGLAVLPGRGNVRGAAEWSHVEHASAPAETIPPHLAYARALEEQQKRAMSNAGVSQSTSSGSVFVLQKH